MAPAAAAAGDSSSSNATAGRQHKQVRIAVIHANVGIVRRMSTSAFVPLEAMAAKKPVTACNSGGPLETVINELTGFLCDLFPIEFSKAISRLVNTQDLSN